MLDNVRQEFNLLNTPPVDANPQWYQTRGKSFERIIYDLLLSERLQPRTNYRPQGEELDGSFVLDSRFYLLEAKWHQNSLPASAIYQFKGKVDGKLIGTIGVFISMSGYSEDAVDAVRFGKTANVILFDGDDFRACLREDIEGFSKVLRAKLRYAAETGDIYYKYESEKIISSTKNDIVFVVEGRTDQILLMYLAKKVLEEKQNVARNIEFIIAMGKIGVASIANAIRLTPTKNARVILVADSDGDIEGTQRLMTARLDYPTKDLLIVHPSIEAWLFPGDSDPVDRLQAKMRAKGISKQQAVAEELPWIDIQALKRNDSTFRDFVRLLTE